MIVNNQFDTPEASGKVPEMVVNADGSTQEREIRIVHEHFMDVFVNEKLVLKLVCTPVNLVELVVGRLISEGIIEDKDDVESIYICAFGKKARVFLKKQVDFQEAVENEPTCCTGNQVILTNRNGSLQKLECPAQPEWKPEWIFVLANEFASGSLIHKATQGTHSCYLSVKGQVVFASEDIGRHNAMDKAIGYAAMQEIKRKDCILYTTGRVPTDMVKKAVAARIPVLVSKSVPTDAAVEMARYYHLTLICKAWPDRYEIFAS